MNKRVNIDRDVRSRKNIAATRTAPIHREEPKTAEPHKDEPQKESGEEAQIPQTETRATPAPAPKTKKPGRTSEGGA